MVHILRYLKILIIFLLAFPVLAEEPTITNAPMATGLVVASCNTLESITGLAHLDKESTEEAKILFNYLRMNGKCGTYGKFIIVFLEKLEFSYIDNSDGEVVEVWKLYNQELWSLVRKSNVKLLGLTI